MFQCKCHKLNKGKCFSVDVCNKNMSWFCFFLGESLAKDTLFLFLTSIFQKFQIYPSAENPKPDFEPEFGFLNVPKPFEVVFKPHA